MRDDLYQHVCTAVLGFASLFRYAGYDMATFIVESVLYSAHLRDSSAIVSHAGFYGSRDFNVYHIVDCADLLPLSGSEVIYIGLATYQMQFSTKDTLARNSARTSAIAGSSLIIGASLYVFISSAESEVLHGHQSSEYRYYSEEETRFMYGACTVLLLISFVLHCFLPNRQIKNSVESQSPHVKQSPTKQARALVGTMFDHSMLKLIPALVNHGIFLVFAMSIYPTSLQFSSILSNDYPQLTAYYAYTMFIGTIACGVFVDPLSKWFRDFSLRPLYFLTLVLQVVMMVLCLLTVPNLSTYEPTNDSSFIPPNLTCVLIISFLCGLIDSMITAANTVYCSRIMPGRASHTYAAARFYIGTSAAIVFFCSPSLSMTYHAVIQMIVLVLAAIGFVAAAKHIDSLEADTKGNMDGKKRPETVELTSTEVDNS